MRYFSLDILKSICLHLNLSLPSNLIFLIIKFGELRITRDKIRTKIILHYLRIPSASSLDSNLLNLNASHLRMSV